MGLSAINRLAINPTNSIPTPKAAKPAFIVIPPQSHATR